jgi:proteasome lid subunit RPN8/RPN11
VSAPVSTELLRLIREEAAATPEVEVCGLLLGRDGRVDEARPCRNVAADPARRFEIDPAALLAAHRAARAGGPAVLGCYHSHPSGRAEPSPCDAAAAEPNGWLWLIVAAGEVRGWRAGDEGVVLGRFDPVRLGD